MFVFLRRLWRWLCGWVNFEAEGGTPGRLLTLAAREGIPLWDTHCKNACLSARCAASDYARLRPLRRRCGLRMHLCERHGASFTLRRYHARPGLIAGIALYAVLLIALSGRIWVIDIRGLQAADEDALRALLSEQNVAVGQKKSAVNPESVQLTALSRLSDISWLAVNIDGCVAEVEVKEMNADEAPAPQNTPSNLVATRDGIVLSMAITGGEATVQVGDAVAEGGLLASGITATEREILVRRSAGVVMAETTHQLCVSVPLREVLTLPCAAPYESLELRLFGWRLPLSDNTLSGDGCRVEDSNHSLTLGGLSLPLTVTLRRYTPLGEQEVLRTVEEAQSLAEERLAAAETAQLAGVQVTERTLSTAVEDGLFTLTADYRCVENIAREIPLQLESTP